MEEYDGDTEMHDAFIQIMLRTRFVGIILVTVRGAPIRLDAIIMDYTVQ
jgi:hypothetical protein